MSIFKQGFQPTDLLHFNVGGIQYTIAASSIMRYPDSKFALVLKEGKKEKEWYLDRNGQIFEYILQYLRNGDSVDLPTDVATLRKLMIEIDFFHLTEFRKLILASIDPSMKQIYVSDG